LRLRTAAFAVLAAWILLSPAWPQVFGGRSPLIRPWVMFASRGSGLVVPEFSQNRPGADPVVLDRYAILGFDDRREAPAWVRRIQGRRGLARVVEALCRAAGADADLRVTARVATSRGWERLLVGDSNVCSRRSAPTSP
jgi:hypothetical protein